MHSGRSWNQGCGKQQWTEIVLEFEAQPQFDQFLRPHNGILRLVNIAARNQGPVCLRVLTLYQKELQAGSIVTVRDDRVRIRPPRYG